MALATIPGKSRNRKGISAWKLRFHAGALVNFPGCVRGLLSSAHRHLLHCVHRCLERQQLTRQRRTVMSTSRTFAESLLRTTCQKFKERRDSNDVVGV
jgi:hypothetical protein